MLHEAIFLATRNATMTNKKPFKLQRVCYTLATSFATCNAYNSKQDVLKEGTTRLSPSLVKPCFSARPLAAFVLSVFFGDFSFWFHNRGYVLYSFSSSIFSLSLNFFSLFTTAAVLKSPASERWALIGRPFWQNCVASCRGDVTRKQFVSQRCEKSRVVLLFSQLATQQLQLQNGVLHVNFFLATCNATFVAMRVARKIASCNMAFSWAI